MGLGATHHRYDPDVRRVVEALERRFPAVRCNTYDGHPWPGWDGRSFDAWGIGGRGHPLPLALVWPVWRFVWSMEGAPWLRHTICLHSLWTSFGGWSKWARNDHSGELRHDHFTFWP